MKKKHKFIAQSLSFNQVVTRIIIAGVIILSFYSLIFFLNKWYFYSLSKDSDNLLLLPKKSATAESKLAQSPKGDIGLTFYERLGQEKNYSSPGPLTPASRRKSASSYSQADQEKPKLIPSDSKTFKKEEPSQKNPKYTVQVGSFQNLKGAEIMLKNLKRRGFSPYIIPFHLSNGQMWYRVRVGHFLLREEAEKFAQKIQHGQTFQPLIVSLKDIGK